MNDTLVDIQTRISYQISEGHLNKEGNDTFTLDGQIKSTFVNKDVANLSKQKFTKAETPLLSKGLKFVPTDNINKAQVKMEPYISTTHKALEKIWRRGDLNAETIFYRENPKFAGFYLLSKIHKWLHDVPGGPVISNYGQTFIWNLWLGK